MPPARSPKTASANSGVTVDRDPRDASPDCCRSVAEMVDCLLRLTVALWSDIPGNRMNGLAPGFLNRARQASAFASRRASEWAMNRRRACFF